MYTIHISRTDCDEEEQPSQEDSKGNFCLVVSFFFLFDLLSFHLGIRNDENPYHIHTLFISLILHLIFVRNRGRFRSESRVVGEARRSVDGRTRTHEVSNFHNDGRNERDREANDGSARADRPMDTSVISGCFLNIKERILNRRAGILTKTLATTDKETEASC